MDAHDQPHIFLAEKNCSQFWPIELLLKELELFNKKLEEPGKKSKPHINELIGGALLHCQVPATTK